MKIRKKPYLGWTLKKEELEAQGEYHGGILRIRAFGYVLYLEWGGYYLSK